MKVKGEIAVLDKPYPDFSKYDSMMKLAAEYICSDDFFPWLEDNYPGVIYADATERAKKEIIDNWIFTCKLKAIHKFTQRRKYWKKPNNERN